MGPKCNHIRPHKRKAKGDLIQTKRRRQCDPRDREQRLRLRIAGGH